VGLGDTDADTDAEGETDGDGDGDRDADEEAVGVGGGDTSAEHPVTIIKSPSWLPEMDVSPGSVQVRVPGVGSDEVATN